MPNAVPWKQNALGTGLVISCIAVVLFFIQFLGNKDPSCRVSDDDLRAIATSVVKVWMPLGRELGLPQSTIDNIDLDYNTAYEKTYQMFLKWTRTKVERATYGALVVALCHPSVGRDDLVSIFC